MDIERQKDINGEKNVLKFSKNKMIKAVKTKSDLLKEMQIIAEEIEKRKEEVELLLKIIEGLEANYFAIAEKIKNG